MLLSYMSQNKPIESMQRTELLKESFQRPRSESLHTILLFRIGVIFIIPFPLVRQGKFCFGSIVLLVFCISIRLILLSFILFVFTLKMIELNLSAQTCSHGTVQLNFFQATQEGFGEFQELTEYKWFQAVLCSSCSHDGYKFEM
jgi:hypothetical protein